MLRCKRPAADSGMLKIKGDVVGKFCFAGVVVVVTERETWMTENKFI